jgi:hypothetical protein
MSNRSISNFYAKIFTILLECTAGELGFVISDDPIQNPKLADDGLDELDCRLLVDLDRRGRFRPLGEFVDDDVEILVPFDGPGKWL